MRYEIYLVVVAQAIACTTDSAPAGLATFSASTTVTSAHAVAGFASYGAPYHTWTIALTSGDGCTAATVASFELDTLASVTDIPTGAIAIRTTINPDTVPSGLINYPGATATGGTIMIDSTNGTLVTGSAAASVTLNGAPAQLMATFTAPICAQ